MSILSFLSQYLNTNQQGNVNQQTTRGISSIDVFRSSVGSYTDLARSDRFIVSFRNLGLFAQSVSLKIPNSERLLELRCEEAELPGRTLDTINSRTYGPILKYPSLSTYSDINLTFLCSTNPVGSIENGLPEKMIFENWMDYINPSPNKNVIFGQASFWNFNYKENYAREIEIKHYGPIISSKRFEERSAESGDNPELIYGVKLIDAFPISINQISLGWGNDSIARLIVTFAYSRWERITTPETGVKDYARVPTSLTAPNEEIGAFTNYLTGQSQRSTASIQGPPGAPAGTPTQSNEFGVTGQ